ncbi:PucR family transcriptional regulator ligand-binding domain-containing protein [Glutamicibacter ectropisis]|uniref:PucR family transcriptional regulator ligand-binding domain-containing protein n=1 Tax=Glutamicibacter ectropisis TaxID=3046593 RepID=A0AAU6WEN8_9MICC
MASLLTVADLIADPTLDTNVIAGATGLDRTVRWAQTSESAEPWKWLGPEELLMTLGLNVPTGPEGQKDYVRQVHTAGIPGIAIGADGLAPSITTEMRLEADRLGLPLLSTGTSTPFVVIARTVAAATTNQLNRGVLMLSRLYQEAGSQSAQAKRRGDWAKKLLGVQVAVEDTATGCTVIGTRPTGALRRHSLSTLRTTQLLIPAEDQIDALLLVHLKLILSVDTNALLQQAESSISSGESLLRLGLAGQLSATQVKGGKWLAPGETFRVLAAPEKHGESLSMSLALHGLVPLQARWKQHAVAIVREQDLGTVRQISAAMNIALGSSLAQRDLVDLAGAAEEAISALPEASEAGVHEFSGLQVSLLARSASEAQGIISRVLGPLASETGQAELFRSTLFSLLEHDMQWQRTANALSIHRQTLVYRIKQVEEATGRSVRKVADLSDFHLARQAWVLLHD